MASDGELEFGVTSSIGTSIVVYVPATCDVATLTKAVAAEHQSCYPKLGKVVVKSIHGKHVTASDETWVPVSDATLRRRAFSRLLAEVTAGKTADGLGFTANAIDASPVALASLNAASVMLGSGARGASASPFAAHTPATGGVGGVGGVAQRLSLSAAAASAGGGDGRDGRDGNDAGAGVNQSRLGKRSAARQAEDDAAAMPPPPAKKATKAKAAAAAAPPAAKEKDAASAAATFSAKLAEGVKDLFLHGGEALGSPPIRNVTFAKNLKITNSFISAVEKLDTQSLSTLMRSVKPVVDGVKEAQKKTEESVRLLPMLDEC